MSLKSIRAHVIIFGNVQGVGMRARTSNMAKSLKLSGWVRNLDSGEVEAVFEGDEGNIKKMVEWCQSSHGPIEISDVKVVLESYVEGLKGFSIM
jgi:acylphosphatase